MKNFTFALIIFIITQPISYSESISDIHKVLDQKITYASKGKIIKQQLEKLSDQYNFSLHFSEDIVSLLSLKTKKFYYPHTRLSHVLRRLCDDAGLTYKIQNSKVSVFALKKDLSNSIVGKDN